MDVRRHHRAESLEHHTVTLDSSAADESRRHHRDPEMASAVPRSSMSGVQVTLIDDFDLDGIEPALEQLSNTPGTISVGRQCPSPSGASFSEVRIAIQTACAMAVSSVKPIVPAVLKMVHVSMS